MSSVMAEVCEKLRFISFYLPQFHPIPENDAWWGAGFTEWTNVVRARPRFTGHHQPHLPADLGFYDLRLPETRQAQADLATQHGVQGFCYYHYWFEGRRLLERPFEEVRRLGEPSLPFCLCWANEDWTRRWDGSAGTMLMRQTYSREDDLRHIRSLLPAFSDPRYIRVDGRPLFLVYRASRLPEPQRTTDLWREEARRSGIHDLFLCRVESFVDERCDPRALGFDAAVEFAPDWSVVRRPAPQRLAGLAARRLGIRRVRGRIGGGDIRLDYATLVERMLAKPTPEYVRFPCVTPSWDNSARRSQGAVIVSGSSPAAYEDWLRHASERPGSRLVFVNAWNEWAEGCHLEPCQRWGREYLSAHRRVALGAPSTGSAETLATVLSATAPGAARVP
jgi:hypothetical protein